MAVTSSPSEALTLYKPVIPAMVAGIVLLLLQPRGLSLPGVGAHHHGRLLPRYASHARLYGHRLQGAHPRGPLLRRGDFDDPRRHAQVGSVVADGFLFAPFWTAQLRTDICLVAVLLLAIIGMLFFTMPTCSGST